MLIVERNVIIPTEYVKKQVLSLLNNFIHNNIEKKARMNNWDSKMIKHHLEMEINKAEDNALFVGEIRTKEQVTKKNIKLNVFFRSSSYMKNNDALYQHDSETINGVNGDIYVDFGLLFSDNKQYLINRIMHEVIHGIQKYKGAGNYYHFLKYPKPEDIRYFEYFTEQSEFDAQIGELAYNIISVFNTNKEDSKNILEILKTVLNMNREDFGYANWYGRNDEDTNKLYEKLFDTHYHFIQSIANPPLLSRDDPEKSKEYGYINKMMQRRSNNCFIQFKQKLFNIYQKLKEKNK